MGNRRFALPCPVLQVPQAVGIVTRSALGERQVLLSPHPAPRSGNSRGRAGRALVNSYLSLALTRAGGSSAPPPESRHGGVVLICVLVCLGIASVVTLEALRISLRQRRQVQHHLQMEQTQWVLEAGWRRAHAAWTADRTYSGETWSLEGVLQPNVTALVDIRVSDSPQPNAPEQWLVTATLRTHDPVPIITRRSQIWPFPSRSTTVPSPSTQDNS